MKRLKRLYGNQAYTDAHILTHELHDVRPVPLTF